MYADRSFFDVVDWALLVGLLGLFAAQSYAIVQKRRRNRVELDLRASSRPSIPWNWVTLCILALSQTSRGMAHAERVGHAAPFAAVAITSGVVEAVCALFVIVRYNALLRS